MPGAARLVSRLAHRASDRTGGGLALRHEPPSGGFVVCAGKLVYALGLAVRLRRSFARRCAPGFPGGVVASGRPGGGLALRVACA